jgi:hypothetical protein
MWPTCPAVEPGVTQAAMALLFSRGRVRAWFGPQSEAAEVANPVVYDHTADVAAAQAALTGVRHAPYINFGDARPYDLTPERCWRCDAAQGETDVGLCPTCHVALTTPT